MQEVFKNIIEDLKKKIVITWEHDYYGGRKDAFNEAIKIIEQAAAEYNNGWIPVSERLPEEHKQYDITTKNDAGIHSDTAIFNPFVGMWFWDEAENNPIEIEVLAWAEKREPYQPKGE